MGSEPVAPAQKAARDGDFMRFLMSEVGSLEAIVNVLTVRFPPAVGKDDEAVELEVDDASGEGGSDLCSEQSDPEPEPEVVQYVRANGGREPAHLITELADGMLLTDSCGGKKGRRANATVS